MNQQSSSITTRTTTPRHKRQRFCSSGCSSTSLFCIVLGCSFFLIILNLVASQQQVFIYGGNLEWTVPPTSAIIETGTQLQTQQQQQPGACDGFDGIFLISQGDIGGAAGTVFFQFVIGQIIYAEKYNLKPYVHLNNVSYVIYDPIVHGSRPGVSFKAVSGMNASHIVRPNGHWRDRVPGPPIQVGPLDQTTFHLEGSGVWSEYFEPVSDFLVRPGDTSCELKPLVQMELFLITPGIHGFAEWAPRCWRYQYAPDYMTKPHIPLHEWLEPQRILANRVMNKSIHVRVDIEEAARHFNPDCSLLDHPCLGLHIRQSDKAAGRRQIRTDEFLPYVIAFIKAGGKSIYLATDSTKVLDEVNATWPAYIQDNLRTIGTDVIRSSDEKAVFDIGETSHDRTNREIMIEIVALANCQFLIHGLSAVTESSIWKNVELHDRSVNLEDPEQLSPMFFGTLVQMVLRGEPRNNWPSRRTMHKWWNQELALALPSVAGDKPTRDGESCHDYSGVLMIANVGANQTAGVTFFHSIINQLLYAEMHNLKPLIHLGQDSPLLYDEFAHSHGQLAVEFQGEQGASTEHDLQDNTLTYPGKPATLLGTATSSVKSLQGNGIWDSYFHPIPASRKIGENPCGHLPLVSLNASLVTGMSLWCPWCLQAWRYNGIPERLWKQNNVALKSWYAPMRAKGHEIVKKYYRFRPHIELKAERINPIKDVNNTVIPCLAIHLRNSFKKGDHRQLVKAKEFQSYMEAFQRAGGQSIFIATDSHRVMTLMTTSEDFPDSLQKIIHSQGPYVVRSSGGKINKWPVHELADHHRINSEVLVDVLAMSKCQLFLHGFSTTSEAVFYLNPDLHERSLNMEDPERLSPEGFEQLSRQILASYHSVPLLSNVQEQGLAPGTSVTRSRRFLNTTVLTRNPPRLCKRNSIIYLAQKKHSSYGRDSYTIMMKSLDLMFKNYLSLGNHKENTDIFIFHTGDFNATDLLDIESRFGLDYHGIVKLVDLSGSKYWQRPSWHLHDNPLDPDPKKRWFAYPLFSEGYRHMMRWYAIGLWDFFDNYNRATGCSYRYLFRLDEDSYLHSPIKYDIFDQMETNNYVYGYRMCAYEMKVTQRIMRIFRKQKGASFNPVRKIDLEMCGFYNNFFVADIQYFNSPPVKDFLRIVDRQGVIYRRRLGDLMIHSMAVYLFAPPERIHRFLDFTYQHATENQTTGCVEWGGIEAGYDDPNAETTLNEYYQKQVVELNCPYNATFLSEADLSPNYTHHIPSDLKGRLFLHSIMSGNVELPGKGNLSG